MARKPALPGVDRRQQILEAALDTFADQGFEGASTKEIAERAGVTQGLIYFYFANKADLFLAAFEHQATQAFDQLDLAGEQVSDEPPEVVMRRVIARFIDVLSSPRSVCMLRIMRHSEGLAVEKRADAAGESAKKEGHRQVMELARRMSEQLRAYLESQIARGALRPVDAALTAQILISTLVSMTMRRALDESALQHTSRDALIESIVDLFLHGLLRSPGLHLPEPSAS
ncbi:MAG: multidrug efflux transporter transcriptional repressor AcrR [Ktedonobacterales bacterium]